MAKLAGKYTGYCFAPICVISYSFGSDFQYRLKMKRFALSLGFFFFFLSDFPFGQFLVCDEDLYFSLHFVSVIGLIS